MPTWLRAGANRVLSALDYAAILVCCFSVVVVFLVAVSGAIRATLLSLHLTLQHEPIVLLVVAASSGWYWMRR